MQIKFLGTGSSGNCIAIQTGSTTILIDIGIPKTKVEKKLIEAGINPGNIDAIFLTHAHGDHVAGLPLAAKWNIPVYASEGTWKSMKFDGGLPLPNMYGNFIHIKDFEVRYFNTHHNDYSSNGYTVDDGEYKVSVCLDTGHIDADMINAMRDSNAYIIEANHDRDKVALSDYPESVKARNLSDLGHLANEQSADALCKLVRGQGEHIYLAHLSKSCNTPALARLAVMSALVKRGFRPNEHYTLEVV